MFFSPLPGDSIGVSPQLGMSCVGGLPAALSDPKGPESLFFAGPKKSNPMKWPNKLTAGER
ncbi:hypothetical protein GCM10007901_26430 [Dyella acidisoli]|uniref:Uncharacterized protein n=1 Tax=Dyella acidisoli TaxID=1867834 RepID=A0ABQ5XSF4_9GAMM|nr:hypothetical protein GCM10007901_26430 [Dyella acidisoli]